MENAIVLLSALFAAVMIAFVRETFFPERGMERDLKRIEGKLKTLKKGGRWARLVTWIDAPFLKGDVERYIFLLEHEKALINHQLQLYRWIRETGGGPQ